MLEAEGNAAAILARANASADAIVRLSQAIGKRGGTDAVSLQIAEKYVDAFGKIAKEGTTVLLPSNTNDPSSMVASALAIFGNIQKAQNAAKTSGAKRESDADDENDDSEANYGEYKLDDFDEKK